MPILLLFCEFTALFMQIWAAREFVIGFTDISVRRGADSAGRDDCGHDMLSVLRCNLCVMELTLLSCPGGFMMSLLHDNYGT